MILDLLAWEIRDRQDQLDLLEILDLPETLDQSVQQVHRGWSDTLGLPELMEQLETLDQQDL